MIVDNASYCFQLNVQNGIPIIPFFDNKDDNELADLSQFLIDLTDVANIRKYIEDYFQSYKHLQCRTPDEAFDMIFGPSIHHNLED